MWIKQNNKQDIKTSYQQLKCGNVYNYEKYPSKLLLKISKRTKNEIIWQNSNKIALNTLFEKVKKNGEICENKSMCGEKF